MKQNFKISDDFHNKFEESLDMIRNKQDRTGKKRTMRKLTTVAASVVAVALVTMITAGATGIINLDETFKKFAGIQDDPKTQEIALDIASAPTEEKVSDGVTAKVVQAVNDKYSATILVEFSAQEKILNREMEFGGITVDVENTQMAVMSAGIMSDLEFSQKTTIEDFKKKFKEESVISNGKKQPDLSPEEQEKETEKYLNEAKDRYSKKYSEKIYGIINLTTHDDMSGKNIKINIDKLEGITEESKDKIDYKTIVDGAWTYKWKLSSKAHAKTFTIDKKYNGIHFKEVTLSPISIDIKYGETIPMDKETGDGDSFNGSFVGVRFKNGETRVVNGGGGSAGGDGASTSFGHEIINVDEVVSIFVGRNCTEIPLQ